MVERAGQTESEWDFVSGEISKRRSDFTDQWFVRIKNKNWNWINNNKNDNTDNNKITTTTNKTALE